MYDYGNQMNRLVTYFTRMVLDFYRSSKCYIQKNKLNLCSRLIGYEPKND